MLLAADLGSTSFKTAVFTKDGRRVGEASIPLPYRIRTADRAEMETEDVVETFEQAALAAARSAGVPVERLRTAALTSQAQTFCVCDARGRAAGPMIGWSDLRAAREAEILAGKLGDEFHRQTGWPAPACGLLAALALWWKSHLGLADGHRLATLPSLVAMRLGAPFVLDQNLAAMTGLFSIPRNGWWARALEAAGLQPGQLARVVPAGKHVRVEAGAASHRLRGLRSVVFAGNDHTAGAIGCECSPKRSVLTLGTAGVFYRHAGWQPGPYSSDGLWGPYPPGGFYELLHIPHACSALDWADQHLFGSVDSLRFAEKAREARAAPGTVVFDPDKWGTAEAWEGEGSREQMALSVLTGIARRLRSLLPRPSENGLEAPNHEIVLLGGGSRLELWVEIVEEEFGRPLRVSQRDGLDGAARLAGCRPGAADGDFRLGRRGVAGQDVARGLSA